MPIILGSVNTKKNSKKKKCYICDKDIKQHYIIFHLLNRLAVIKPEKCLMLFSSHSEIQVSQAHKFSLSAFFHALQLKYRCFSFCFFTYKSQF